MGQTSMTAEIQALMDHTGWVQDLARKLVRDPDLADDLAQETLLAALKEGTSVRSSKAWLGTVLRNLLWQRVRGDQRRRARELRAARDEGTPSSAEIVERMGAHREVVNTVMSLPEHYRIVLLRRYFEGETPTEIARQMEIPVSTVKTRLARALDSMRQRLDAAHGRDGRRWMVFLAPLLHKPAPSSLPVPARSLALGLSGAVLVVAVALAWPRGVDGIIPMTSPPTPQQAASALLSGGRNSASAAMAQPDRAAIEGFGEVVGPAPGDINLAPRPLHGRVFNAEGGTAAGLVLSFTTWSSGGTRTPIGISDSDGRFEIPGAVGSGLVKVEGEELVTVIAGMAIGNRRDGLNVIVAPRQSMTGTVTDTFGRPLNDARIDLELPRGFQGRFGQVMEQAQLLRHSAVSDAEGEFALARLPVIAGSRLVVRREGFLPGFLPQPTGTDSSLQVTLLQPEKAPGMLEGSVLGTDGEPLPGVRVSCGLEVTRTDEAGHFLLDVTSSPDAIPTRLIAAKQGYLPALLDADVRPGTEEPVWPEHIELRLGEGPLALTGRVVNPEGRGLAGMRVWVGDPTVFSHTPGIPGRGYETRRYESSELHYPASPEVLESYLAGQPERTWNYVVTDAEGSFSVGGLAARAYTLAAMDLETLVYTESEPVTPGNEVLLILDLSAVHESVTGHVIDRAGRPVAGVGIQVQRPAFSLRFEGSVIQRTSTSWAWTVSGLDGGFSFYDVARNGAVLRLSGMGIVPLAHELGDETSLEITVARHMHMQVHTSAREGDQIAVLNDQEEELAMQIIQSTQRLLLRRADLVDGRSEVLSVPDSAETLLVYRGGEPHKRLPLQLAPGIVNQIRF